MAKWASKSAAETLECQESVDEHRRTGGCPVLGGTTGTRDPDQAAPWASDDPHRRFDDCDRAAFQGSTRSARPSVWSRCRLMVTSSSRVRSSCWRSLSVVVGAAHKPSSHLRGRGWPASPAAPGFSAARSLAGKVRPRRRPAAAGCCSIRFPGRGPPAGCRVDRPVTALGSAGPVAGLFDLLAPLGQRRIVAVLELPGGGQAGLPRGRRERRQERLRDRGVDRDATDPQCRVPRPSTS